MDKLLGVPEIMARYGCCRKTASRIINEMQHLKVPRLLAPEWAVLQWERDHMVAPEQPTPKPKLITRSRAAMAPDFRIPMRKA